MTRYVVWEEPWCCGDDSWVTVGHRMKETDCIKYQRGNMQRRVFRPHIYETDAQALDDFLATYWAWIEDIAD